MRRIAQMLTLFGLSIALVHADAPPPSRALTEMSNSGFVANPPEAWNKQFPMCDAFLKVTWIDRKKKIGFAHFDVFDSNGNRVPPGAAAIVDLDEYQPTFDYSATKYLLQQQGSPEGYRYSTRKELPELFAFIRKGSVERVRGSLRIVNGVQAIEFLHIGDVRDEDLHLPNPHDISLAGHRQTVCIPYPGNRRMWIVELRRAGYVYGAEKSERVFAELKESVPRAFSPEQIGLGNALVIDLNHDGIDDYFVGDTVIYSYGGRYYAAEQLWKDGTDSQYGNWRFPPGQAECRLFSMNGYLNLTTDGKSYFSGFACNVTELTDPSGRQ